MKVEQVSEREHLDKVVEDGGRHVEVLVLARVSGGSITRVPCLEK